MIAPEQTVEQETVGELDRRTYIGGSDVAAIIGVSPWATAVDVYLRKRGEVPKFDEERQPAKNRLFKRGRRAEPHAIDMAIEDLGIKVTKRSGPEGLNRYKDPEYGFLAAEIDFEWEVTKDIAGLFGLDVALIGTIQNGEVKSVHPFAAYGKFGEPNTDEIPVEYAAQAMHGLMVTGKRLAMFLVLTGWDELSVYFVRRDDDVIAGMRRAELALWNEHIVPGIPPDPVNLPDVKNLFAKLGRTRIEATPEIAAKVGELAVARRQASALEKLTEQLQFQIGAFMLGAEKMANPQDPGDHVLTLNGEPILTVTLQQQFTLNDAMVKAKHPDIAEKCAKLLQFFVFKLPRKKAKKLEATPEALAE